MTTLAEQLSLLMADAQLGSATRTPAVMQTISYGHSARSRTVYSVGEAINLRVQNAKLGASSYRDTGARRQTGE